MTPPHRTRAGTMVGCCVTVAFALGCASPPTAELELAAARLARARAAEAAVYASEPLAGAEAALDEAERLAADGAHLESIHRAGRAVSLADTAFDEAGRHRRVTERHVSRCLRELRGLLAIAASRGASVDAEANYRALEERVVVVETRALAGDLLGALDEGTKLKPELLAFELAFR